MVRLTGNVPGVEKLFDRCGWQVVPDSDASVPYQYQLMVQQNATIK